MKNKRRWTLAKHTIKGIICADTFFVLGANIFSTNI